MTHCASTKIFRRLGASRDDAAQNSQFAELGARISDQGESSALLGHQIPDLLRDRD
jgi:hypothetical protein